MKINDNQRTLLIVAAVVIFCMLLFPPWVIIGGRGNAISSGYAFMLDLPSRATIDTVTLVVQWLGVLIVGAIIFFILGDHRD